MAVVDAEALTLGIVAAAMILVCHRDFTTRTVRRGAWIGISFFLCAGWMHLMRASVYTQGGRSLLSRFGDWDLAVPGTLFCLAVWAGLRWRAWRGRPEVSLCRLGRVLTAVTLAAVTVLFLAVTFVPGFPSLGALDNFFKFNDDWGTYRGVAWKAAFAAWWDAPLWRKLLGYGPGTFHEVIAAWAGDAMTARLNTRSARLCEYIEQLLSTGLLGLAAWGAFLFFHLRARFCRVVPPACRAGAAGAVQLSGAGGGFHPRVHAVPARHAAVRRAGRRHGPAAARPARNPRQRSPAKPRRRAPGCATRRSRWPPSSPWRCAPRSAARCCGSYSKKTFPLSLPCQREAFSV